MTNWAKLEDRVAEMIALQKRDQVQRLEWEEKLKRLSIEKNRKLQDFWWIRLEREEREATEEDKERKRFEKEGKYRLYEEKIKELYATLKKLQEERETLEKTNLGPEKLEIKLTNTMTDLGSSAAETAQPLLTHKSKTTAMEEMFARFLKRQSEKEKIQAEQRRQLELKIIGLETKFSHFVEKLQERDTSVSGRTRRAVKETEQTDQQPEQIGMEGMLAKLLENQKKDKEEQIRRENEREKKIMCAFEVIKGEIKKIDVLTERIEIHERKHVETETKITEVEKRLDVICIKMEEGDKKIEEVENRINNKFNSINHDIVTRTEAAKDEIGRDTARIVDNWASEVENKIDLRCQRFEEKMIQVQEVKKQLNREIRTLTNFDTVWNEYRNQVAEEISIIDDRRETDFALIKKNMDEHKRDIERKLDKFKNTHMSYERPVATSWTDIKPPTFEGKDNENPLRYLEALKNYFCLHPHTTEHEKAIIAGFHMKGRAKVWWLDIQTEVLTLAAFEEKFKKKFWNEGRQTKVRNILLTGEYKPGDMTKEEYARHIIRDVIYLDIPIPEIDVVRYVLRHFDEQTCIWARMKEVRSFDKLYELLENLSLNEPLEISETTDEPFRDKCYSKKSGQNRRRYIFHKNTNDTCYRGKHQEGPARLNPTRRFQQRQRSGDNFRNTTIWRRDTTMGSKTNSFFKQEGIREDKEDYQEKVKKIRRRKNSPRCYRE